jgi:16S rRNA processing protein RimM
LLEIGRVVKPHGLKGEVIVAMVSNLDDRLAPGTEVEGSGRRFRVLTSKVHQGRLRVQFEGVSSREEAEAIRDVVLMGEPPGESEAGEDLWVHQLIGSTVFDTTGAEVGRVASVEANPASDLLVLEAGGLIPCRFVVSHGDGRVEVEVPEGLLDL